MKRRKTVRVLIPALFVNGRHMPGGLACVTIKGRKEWLPVSPIPTSSRTRRRA